LLIVNRLRRLKRNSPLKSMILQISTQRLAESSATWLKTFQRSISRDWSKFSWDLCSACLALCKLHQSVEWCSTEWRRDSLNFQHQSKRPHN